MPAGGDCSASWLISERMPAGGDCSVSRLISERMPAGGDCSVSRLVSERMPAGGDQKADGVLQVTTKGQCHHIQHAPYICHPGLQEKVLMSLAKPDLQPRHCHACWAFVFCWAAFLPASVMSGQNHCTSAE